MTALNPWFLLAAASVAVPLFLHLFHRRHTARVSFPALRYLERTEREHARRIRLRQILLLLVRLGILLAIVGAGARLVVLGDEGAHPPTAAVLVLDNSMSSGTVLGDRRLLDELKDLAERALDLATPEDRFWVVLAGQPWTAATPGTAAEARALVRAAEPTAAAGDLSAALRRAAELLETSELSTREIHLLSDLQASAFDSETEAPAGGIPVVVWSFEAEPPENRGLIELVVGRGLPPLEGQRAELTVRVSEDDGDASPVDVRVLVDDRIRAAAAVPRGSEATVALPPSGPGWTAGLVETEPDALRADDRRYFAFRPRPAPAVTIGGPPGRFLDEAVSVLEGAGRLRRAPIGEADLLVAPAGEGLAARRPTTAAWIIPAADATLLPALNRRLAAAGIGWRYEPSAPGGATELTGTNRPEALESVRVESWFSLAPVGEPPAGTRTLAEAAGTPWAVETTDTDGRPVLLLASPLDAASTDLPTSTGLVRLVDWVTGAWSGGSSRSEEWLAGERIPAPSGATHVRPPSGESVEIDGTRTVARTGEAGHYAFLAGDSLVGMVAVNPPGRESRLERLEGGRLAAAVGPETVIVERAERWAQSVFRERTGPELWRVLVALALALLVLESLLAASGGARPATRRVAATGPSNPSSSTAAQPATTAARSSDAHV